MSEAPASIWVRPDLDAVLWSDKPDAVRYVRADIYEALQARMDVVRSWNEAPCLEPLEAIKEQQRLQR